MPSPLIPKVRPLRKSDNIKQLGSYGSGGLSVGPERCPVHLFVVQSLKRSDTHSRRDFLSESAHCTKREIRHGTGADALSKDKGKETSKHDDTNKNKQKTNIQSSIRKFCGLLKRPLRKRNNKISDIVTDNSDN